MHLVPEPIIAIDFDTLCHYLPTDLGDPLGNILGFENLSAVWCNGRNRGIYHALIARVVESRGDMAG